MAAKTTSGAGLLTDGAKWGGGVAPVSGADTLTINHAMTWAPAAGSSFTIGTGSGTVLTFGTGGSLTITGLGAFDLVIAGAVTGGNISTYELVVNATNGAVTITFDATGAGAGFAIVTGGNYDANNRGGWNLVGSATYGITVASLPSDASKNSYFSSGGQFGGGVVNGSYFTLRRIGVASATPAFAPALDNRLRNIAWSNVTLDACGQVSLGGDSNYTGTIAFTNVISSNTATNGTTAWPLSYSMAATPTANFNGCVFDKTIKFAATRGFNASGCYFHNGWTGTTGAYHGGTVTASFIRQTFDSLITAFSVTYSFLYWDAPGGSNPHWLSANGSAPAGTTFNWNNNAVYYNGTDAAGNVYSFNPTNATNLNTNYNLLLPNSAGSNSGALVTSGGAVGSGAAITANHNTLFVEGQHGFELGHLYPGADAVNRFAAAKSNLFIGGTTGYKAIDVDPVLITDIMPPAVVDYNGSYQIKTTAGTVGFTNEGKGYAGKKYRGFFVGMAPIEQPRIVVAVMIDEPSNGRYFGGDVAAPVFSETVQQTLRLLGVQPDMAVKPQVVTKAVEESF